MKTRKSAEADHHPLELQKDRAEADEEGAEDQGAEDPEVEDPVPELGGNPEVVEDHHEDEEVVDGERVLDDVAREELHGRLHGRGFGGDAHRGMAPQEGERPEVQADVEEERHHDPDHREARGFAHADPMRLLVEDAEVDGQETCRSEGSRARYTHQTSSNGNRRAVVMGSRVILVGHGLHARLTAKSFAFGTLPRHNPRGLRVVSSSGLSRTSRRPQ